MLPSELSAEFAQFAAQEPDWFGFRNVRRRLNRIASSVVFRWFKVLNSTQRFKVNNGSLPEERATLIQNFATAYPIQPQLLLDHELFLVDKYLYLHAFRNALCRNAQGLHNQIGTLIGTLQHYYTSPETLDDLAVFTRYALAARFGTHFAHMEGVPIRILRIAREGEDPVELRPPIPSVTDDSDYVPPAYDPPLFARVYNTRYAAQVGLQVATDDQVLSVCYAYHPIIRVFFELDVRHTDIDRALLGGAQGRRQSLFQLVLSALALIKQGQDALARFITDEDPQKNWKPYQNIVEFTTGEFVSERERARFSIYMEEVLDEVAYPTAADRLEQFGFILALAGVGFLGAGLGGTIVATVFAGVDTTTEVIQILVRHSEVTHLREVDRAALVDRRLASAESTEDANLDLGLGILSIALSEVGGELLSRLIAGRKALQSAPVEHPQLTSNQPEVTRGNAQATMRDQRGTEPQLRSNQDSEAGIDDRSNEARLSGDPNEQSTQAVGARGNESRISGHDSDLDADVDQAFDDLQSGGSPRHPSNATSRPPRPPEAIESDAQRRFERAREEFNQRRDEYARRLLLREGSGGQVHHAIELVVIRRYPGAYTADELNDFLNMRGVIPERTGADVMDPRRGKKQLHNSKIRQVWDRAYGDLDRKLRERLADPLDVFEKDFRPGSDYNQFIRNELEQTRRSIDRQYHMFFSENRGSLNWDDAAMLPRDRASLDRATRESVVEDLPPRAR